MVLAGWMPCHMLCRPHIILALDAFGEAQLLAEARRPDAIGTYYYVLTNYIVRHCFTLVTQLRGEVQAGVVEARIGPESNVKGFSQTRLQEDNSIKVTLQDCLACSGCVTSAETVLLEHQSTQEFCSKLEVQCRLWPSLTASMRSFPPCGTAIYDLDLPKLFCCL